MANTERCPACKRPFDGIDGEQAHRCAQEWEEAIFRDCKRDAKIEAKREAKAEAEGQVAELRRQLRAADFAQREAVAAAVRTEREKKAKVMEDGRKEGADEAARQFAAERRTMAKQNTDLQAKLTEAQRLLEKKRANEIGADGEYNLIADLRAAVEDTITELRTDGDALQTPYVNGVACSSALWEKKTNRSWLEEFEAKLKANMLTRKCPLGVIVTDKPPSVKRENGKRRREIFIVKREGVKPLAAALSEYLQAVAAKGLAADDAGALAALRAYVLSPEFKKHLAAYIEDAEALRRLGKKLLSAANGVKETMEEIADRLDARTQMVKQGIARVLNRELGDGNGAAKKAAAAKRWLDEML